VGDLLTITMGTGLCGSCNIYGRKSRNMSTSPPHSCAGPWLSNALMSGSGPAPMPVEPLPTPVEIVSGSTDMLAWAWTLSRPRLSDSDGREVVFVPTTFGVVTAKRLEILSDGLEACPNLGSWYRRWEERPYASALRPSRFSGSQARN
jgi:hypothetical protein